MIRTVFAGAIMMGLAGPALAIDCTVTALQAYRAAQKAGYTFTCTAPRQGSASFATDRLRGAIGCEAEVSTRYTQQRTVDKFEGHFFGSYKAEVPELENGWTLEAFVIEGGYFTTTLPASNGLIRYYYYLDQQDTRGARWVTKLTLKKEGGDCKAAVKEAFGPISRASR